MQFQHLEQNSFLPESNISIKLLRLGRLARGYRMLSSDLLREHSGENSSLLLDSFDGVVLSEVDSDIFP